MQAAPCQADLLVSALQNIIDSNNSVREALEKGLDAVKLQENWDYLQINCAMYINSDMPGVASQSQPNTKPLRQALSLPCCISQHRSASGRRMCLDRNSGWILAITMP